jgi:hypothetical protein
MKKLILLVLFMIASLCINAQELKIGLSGALPVGDANDISSFGLNAEATYLVPLDRQLDLGLTAGYLHYFSKDFDDYGFLPIALAGRFIATEDIDLGLDLGYALAISPSGNDGGFYYAPKFLYGITETLDIVLSYKGVSLEGISFDVVALGVEFGI